MKTTNMYYNGSTKYKEISAAMLMAGFIFVGCTSTKMEKQGPTNGKIVVYQVFTRLFGNKDTTNKPWGTIAENGVGKFNDITDKALEAIKSLGVTHIWYTGVPHHASVTNYSAFGILCDDPDVVKGRAGSPYAIRDYYNVDPDLAVDPAARLDEFRALVERSHRNGLKVIMDIVPNHVARSYKSISKPAGTEGFGANDDLTVAYSRNNNFYYIPGQSFEVPDPEENYKPLGGEFHPLSDGKFVEIPAKWTGNGSRNPKPSFWDWYETVKINFGVQPDGTADFDRLPEGFENEPASAHRAFWQNRDVPDTWKKFRDIALYWLEFGMDGFRFDMAEMVPVEFWSYLNSAIKEKNPDAFLLAEIYNPAVYDDYIRKGKMDFLYDKVDLYDTLRNIITGKGSADHLPEVIDRLAGVEKHLLRFLENHDEQRIASPEFAGDPQKGLPAMVVAATVGSSPVMVYFGQETGEPGNENAGFGKPSRTSIFDYIGVPHHQRWMNGGRFDGGALLPHEKELRGFYERLLNFTIQSPALMGESSEIHTWNRTKTEGYSDKLFSYVRWCEIERLVVICSFDPVQEHRFELSVPAGIIRSWNLGPGEYNLTDQLNHGKYQMTIRDGEGKIAVRLKPFESVILKVNG